MSLTYTIRFDDADRNVTHRYLAWTINGGNLFAEPLVEVGVEEAVFSIVVEDGDMVEVIGKNVIQFANEFGNIESLYSDPAIIRFTAIKRPATPVAPSVGIELPPVEVEVIEDVE